MEPPVKGTPANTPYTHHQHRHAPLVRPPFLLAPPKQTDQKSSSQLYTYGVRRQNILRDMRDQAFAGVPLEFVWTTNDEVASPFIAALRDEIVTKKNYAEDPWEAHCFVDVKADIEKTALYDILQKMPKGAILHVHASAMGDFANLVKNAAEYKSTNSECFWVSKDSACTNDNEYFLLKGKNFANPRYSLLKTAISSQLGRIMRDLTANTEWYSEHKDVWKLFQPVFARIGPLLEEPDLMKKWYVSAFQYLINQDNVSHVELRTSWTVKNETDSSKKEYIILKALEEVNKGKMPELTMRAIWSDTRHIDPLKVDQWLRNMKYVAEEMQKASEVGVVSENNACKLVGYDLVGEEDTGSTTCYFVDKIIANLLTDKSGKTLFPTMYFHDGESDLPLDFNKSDGQEPAKAGYNNNVIDALLVNQLSDDNGAKIGVGRIGHAIELFKSPLLMQRYRDQGIAVELCPVSNQLLRYIGDLREHPGQIYINSGVPCSLSPDDPAIFGYQGVTFDFWEACVAWNLDLKVLKLLCFNSLWYSALSFRDKKVKIDQWLKQWDRFIIDEVITKHGNTPGWRIHPGKYLSEYPKISPTVIFRTLPEAQEAASRCGYGITYEPESASYTLRVKDKLLESPRSEISWLKI